MNRQLRPKSRMTLFWALAWASTAAVPAAAQSLPPPPNSPDPVTQFEYDAQGNPTVTRQAGNATTRSFDTLNRLRTSQDARAGLSRLEYAGGADPLVRFTDPRQLITQMPRDGLGQLEQLTSPDTGTALHTYDAAGNLLTRTDSRGVLASYSYDALNRPTQLSFSWNGQTPMVFAWTYDQTGAGFSFGIGRLTSTSYPGGGSRFAYDAQGRLVSSTQLTAVDLGVPLALQTQYGYNAAGQWVSLVYPSGRVLNISYSGGLPTSLSLGAGASGSAMPLISQIQHEPFGDVHGWTFHMSTGTQVHERLFDAWGRMVRYPMGAVLRDLTYDAADRIASYTHLDRNSGAATAAATALNQSFGYDELGRLTSATGAPGTWRYTYDDNGNRLSATTAGSARAYGVDNASNRLLSIHNPSRVLGYDAAGNTISDVSAAANWTPGYDLSNRLAGLSGSVANGPDVSLGFLYDAHGQRVAKLAAVSPQCTLVGNKKICPLVGSQATTTLYVYDQGGHLLGEYRAADGSAIREYIWLRDIPVAVLDYPTAGAAGTVYYVQADHLNTPRVLTDRAGLVRWTWGGEPFGQSAANDNPSGVGAFTFNLRFPGQYYDVESGFINNGFRVLDASVGRYTQSDPIGLAGGINTYAYVGGNPISYVDPEGLNPSDKWYGFNSPAFRDYVHGIKQEWNLPPGYTFDKDELKNLNACWKEEGEPRGKGGKSGKGGRGRDWNRIIRGGGGRTE